MSKCKTCISECEASDDLVALGSGQEFVVALAGNPNTGKSTVFNHLTGLRQHTGNWPGKTVARAEGSFSYKNADFKVIDLPGTYSLLANSVDEEIARDFILFGRPDCTVVMCDATVLERNLNLVLQVLEITDRVVVCVNLMDEADRKEIALEALALEKELGVPVVPTAARAGQGLDHLLKHVHEIASGKSKTNPLPLELDPDIESSVQELSTGLNNILPHISRPRWIALRLLEADQHIESALSHGNFHRELEFPEEKTADSQESGPTLNSKEREAVEKILGRAKVLQQELGAGFRDQIIGSLYARAARISQMGVTVSGRPRKDWDLIADRLLTSRLFGFPIMLLGLVCILWMTIQGANAPSGWLFSILFYFHDVMEAAMNNIGAPWWLTGFLINGVYRGLAWVVAVMLPPMAIFFPIFTLLEDVGYLPRVAFNLDRLFRWCGANGKQSLTMGMGFGCNAAGIISCRIIDSPRERLIAILTNNFMLCNGRWPTIIMLASVFIAASFPPFLSGLVATAAVAGVTLLGVLVTFVASKFLSQTVLKGEPSHFFLELPPYRRPSVLKVIYRSMFDRTLFVLARACVVAAPAGGLIWLLGNVDVAGQSLMVHTTVFLDPIASVIGLDGVILLAFIVAIPANEIVVPTMIMAYMAHSQMIELDNMEELSRLFLSNGWTLTTAACMMLFSLLHYPCATTTWTIYRETGSLKWTLWANLMPLSLAVVVCALVAQLVKLF